MLVSGQCCLFIPVRDARSVVIPIGETDWEQYFGARAAAILAMLMLLLAGTYWIGFLQDITVPVTDLMDLRIWLLVVKFV